MAMNLFGPIYGREILDSTGSSLTSQGGLGAMELFTFLVGYLTRLYGVGVSY
jgi:hypothetical protein